MSGIIKPGTAGHRVEMRRISNGKELNDASTK